MWGAAKVELVANGGGKKVLKRSLRFLIPLEIVNASSLEDTSKQLQTPSIQVHNIGSASTPSLEDPVKIRQQC